MSTIVTRAGKGSPLTHNEVDANFNNLNNDKYESGSSPSFAGATLSSGNLTFSSTGQRITGDFSNATVANRVLFQSSTTNGGTEVGVMPNGTGTSAGWNVYGTPTTAATTVARFDIPNNTETRLLSGRTDASVSFIPMTFYTGGSERMRLDTSGNLGIGAATGAARFLVQGAGTSTTAGGNVVGRFQTNGSGYDASIQLSDNVANSAVFSMVGGAINFISNGSNYMNISAAGNVGIGTASPAVNLNVAKSADGIAARFQRSSGGGLVDIETYNAIGGIGTADNIPFRLNTNNAERMRIDSSGNVGIGTASPNKSSSSKALTVNTGTAANYSAVEWASGDTLNYHINANDSAIYHVAAGTRPWIVYTNGSERMRIDSSGNVGIGVTPSAWGSDTRALQVYTRTSVSDLQNTSQLTNNGYWNGSSWIYIASAAAANYYQQDGAHVWRSAASGTAGNAITWSERMRIDSSGNVGIGTASPGSFNAAGLPLVVGSGSGNNGMTIFSGTASYGGIHFADGTTSTDSYRGIVYYQHSTDNMQFWTAATERMRIDSSGNVGIGTTTTTLSGAAFKAAISNSGFGILGLNNSNNTNQSWGLFVGDSGAGTAGRFHLGQIVNGSGSGIAGGPVVPIISADVPTTANTTPRIFVNADAEVFVGGTTDQGAYNLQCNGTGVWGAGAYVNGSDARLKDNIQSLDSGLDVIKAMRPVTFQYKPEYSKDQSIQPGFIAQELQTAMAGKPYLEGVVQEGTNHLNVAYQNIIPILVKAIQELEAKVATLEAK